MGDIRNTQAWRQARAGWQLVIDQGGVVCRRCGGLVPPGSSSWDLGHPQDRPGWMTRTDPTVIAECRPEHSDCNRRAGRRERKAAMMARIVSPRESGKLW